MMFKKVVVASCLLVASMASQAGIIEYAGYKNDTSGTCASTEKDCKYNIVTHGALEWLKWDVTKGLSITEALSIYGKNGWGLASNVQMAALFSDFKFGQERWVEDLSVLQNTAVAWSEDENSPHAEFHRIFGATITHSYYTEPRYFSIAYFGSDADTGKYKFALVSDDYSQNGRGGVRKSDHNANLGFVSSNMYLQKDVGVSLVRVVNTNQPAPVSLPSSLSLLALGLVGLAYRRRQAKR